MTQADALAWIERLFEVSAGDLTPDTPREEIEAWDSLGVLTLMAALDSDFGIQLSDEQIQGMKSVSDILAILSANGKLAESPQ